MAAPHDQQEQETTATTTAMLRPAERALHAFITRSEGPRAADMWCAQRLECKRRIAVVVARGTEDETRLAEERRC